MVRTIVTGAIPGVVLTVAAYYGINFPMDQSAIAAALGPAFDKLVKIFIP
jgi:hypothetical protein